MFQLDSKKKCEHKKICIVRKNQQQKSMSRERPTSIGIGIIKFNARTNSVCSSPSSSSCCAVASSPFRRVDPLLSVGGAERSSTAVEQRYVELCANDDDNDDDNDAASSTAVSEADECGSVAGECENLVEACGVITSPSDVPVEEVIKSVKLASSTISMRTAANVQKVLYAPVLKANEHHHHHASGHHQFHKFWHKLLATFRHYRTLPFRRLRLFSVSVLLLTFFILPSFLAGLLAGVYFSMFIFLYFCVSEPRSSPWRQQQQHHHPQRLDTAAAAAGVVGEQLDQLDTTTTVHDNEGWRPQTICDDVRNGRRAGRTGRKIYKGWMNILSEHYHPHTFHVNSIQTVLVRLDGNILRISRPERTMLKHCFHVDPTLTEPEPRMISQKIYDLTDAQVLLRPCRLARRRWFSRKYPICIKLASNLEEDNATITVSSDAGIASTTNSTNASARRMKRCHSLRQQQQQQQKPGMKEEDHHHRGHNNGGRNSVCICYTTTTVSTTTDAQRRTQKWEEDDGSDDDSDGAATENSVDEDSEKIRFCPIASVAQSQQIPPHSTTSSPPSPMMSASCPTPAGATTSFDACPSAVMTVDHRRRRRRCRTTTTTSNIGPLPAPPPFADDDDNNNTDGMTAMPAEVTKRRHHQQQRRQHRSVRSSSLSDYIFLFARSTREKERWFHQLRQATSFHQNNTAESLPANFYSKIFPRCTSVPSLDRLAAKLSDERVAYTLQNAQFAKQLASMIAGLGAATLIGAAAASSYSSGGGEQQQQHDGADEEDGIVRMDLGWTTSTTTAANKRTNNNNNNTACKEQPPEGEWADGGNEFILLVNLIASRVFYDFCRDNYWCGAVRNKIQTKLATIHLPYFIEKLELSKLDLGTTTPQIVKVHSPTVNEWGIWCDFDINYTGSIRLVLETRVNLMKLKSVSDESSSSPSLTTANSPSSGGVGVVDSLLKCDDHHQRNGDGGGCTYTTAAQIPTFCSAITYRIPPSRYSDEEIPESPETSPDEEFGTKLKPDDHSLGNGGTRRMKTGQKLINLVDRLAHSKYFREASELKLIRKMMEEISSMRLLLNVEVTTLAGRMCCNFPPPPSDRLWYAFRTPPRMSVKAVPQVGERSVELSLISEWIENKLQLILEKNLVLPNMDDVIIPVCSGNRLLQGVLNK